SRPAIGRSRLARAGCSDAPAARRWRERARGVHNAADNQRFARSMTDTTYEIYAIKYAHLARKAYGNFLNADPHEDADMPLDYFVWAIVGRERTIVVDTGFDAAMA